MRVDDDSEVTRLLRAARADDEAAWAGIVERYAPLVMTVLAGYRVYGADAQDVSQTVWLKLVQHLDDLREPRALPRWLISVANNECLRLIRTRRRTVPVDPLEKDQRQPVDSAEPDEELLRAERIAAAVAALAELTDAERVLITALVEDPRPTYEEIALRLDMPQGSIGPTRGRILAKLRASAPLVALFGNDDWDGGGGRAPELVG